MLQLGLSQWLKKTRYLRPRRRLITADLEKTNLIICSIRGDILVGNFVLVRPDNKNEHVWLARAFTTLNRKKTYALYGKFRVQ